MSDQANNQHHHHHHQQPRSATSSPVTDKDGRERSGTAHAERRSLKAVPLRWAEQAPAEVTKNLNSEEIQQFEIVAELANTEEQYLRDLQVIIDVFIKPIRERNLLPEKEIKNLFGVIELIVPLHQEILKELKKVQALSAKELVLETSEIFCRRAEQFKIYIAHCPALADIQGRIDSLSTRPDFNKFLQECSSRPECRRMLLADFLITPLQRLVKYPLLLATLKKHTPEKNSGNKMVGDAFEKITHVTDLVNEHMRRVSSLKRLQEIKATLEDGEYIDLVQPGRELMRELACKIVEKKSRVIDGHLFIFNDMALVCRGASDKRAVEKELSYVSESLPPELAMKAFDANDALLELRHSQWGLSSARKATPLFLQFSSPLEKNTCLTELNRRARDRYDSEWKAYDTLINLSNAPPLEAQTPTSASMPGEGNLNILDQNLFAATSYQAMLKEQVRRLQEDLESEKQRRVVLQDYALVLRHRLQKATKRNQDNTSTDGTVAKAKYKQLKKRFREVSREKTELEKANSKLKAKVPGIAIEADNKEEKEKKESTTEKFFGLLSPRFSRRQDEPNALSNSANASKRPTSMFVSAPSSPVSKERTAVNPAPAAARPDPRKISPQQSASPPEAKGKARPVSAKVQFFEKIGGSSTDTSPSPPTGTVSAPAVTTVPAASPAPQLRASGGSSAAAAVVSSSSSSASSPPVAVNSTSATLSSSSGASSPMNTNARPVLARIANVPGADTGVVPGSASSTSPPTSSASVPSPQTASAAARRSGKGMPPMAPVGQREPRTDRGSGKFGALNVSTGGTASSAAASGGAGSKAFRGATSVNLPASANNTSSK